MKIAVGTTSRNKLEVLDEVIKKFGLKTTINSVEVSSGVSAQPMSSKETKLGSINRAKNALELVDDSDIGMGIEVGYNRYQNEVIKTFCWTTIVDKNIKVVSAKSHQLILPKFHKEILNSGKYLSEYVDEFLQKNPSLPNYYLGMVLKTRKPLIEISIETCIANYLVESGIIK